MSQTTIRELDNQGAQRRKPISSQDGLSIEDLLRRHSGDDDGQHRLRRLESEFPVPTD